MPTTATKAHRIVSARMHRAVSAPRSRSTTSPSNPSAATSESFLVAVAREYPNLSRQHQIIARYMEQNPHHLGLYNIRTVAQHCNVQPSAIVRFAKHFGLSGYSQIQNIFRHNLYLHLSTNGTYQDRIRQALSNDNGQHTAHSICGEFMDKSIHDIRVLSQNLANLPVDQAVQLLAAAPTLWIAGCRRSFPVATYLNYALSHTSKSVHWVNGLGGMDAEQMQAMRAKDTLIAISFTPYAQETITCAKRAREKGARLLAITDSRLSPLVPLAEIALLVQESNLFGFRSLTNAMALSQSLFVALAYQLALTAPA